MLVSEYEWTVEHWQSKEGATKLNLGDKNEF